MITLVYEAKTPSPLFENEMREISGVEEIQCICSTDFHLARSFNKCLDKSDYSVVVFLREDVRICSKNWGRKIMDAFSTSSHGIIGSLGTLIVPMSGMLWEKEEPLCGSIWYKKYKPQNKNTFGEKFEGTVLDVVALEGSFFAVHKDRLAAPFDESFVGNSFFEYDFYLENFRKGVKVGVVSGIDILKEYFDDQDEDFIKNHKLFIAKHDELPYRITPQVVINKKNVAIDEGLPSVNVIIANKGHIPELIKCLESIYKNSTYKNYKVTIIDHGSKKKELKEITEFIKNHTCTKLIKTLQPHLSLLYNDAALEESSDLVMFMSKQIVLANDIISLMVNTYINNKENCGTVGIRTHQRNNMVRQMGLQLYSIETEEGFELGLDLKGFGKAFAYQNKVVDGVMGNSRECFLVERDIFNSLGGFNENYHHSLEDFELNLKMILEGRKNYLVGTAVAYYSGFERPKFLPKDYMLLMDFINKNIETITPYVNLIKT